MKDKILETLTIKDILTKYNIDIGRNGRCRCPIHNGTNKTAFSFNDKTFNCFRCSISGNVISLVMQMFNINFKSALLKINHDFGLGLTTEKPTLRERRLWAKKQQAERQAYLDKLNLIKLRQFYKYETDAEIVYYMKLCKIDKKNTVFEDEIINNPEILKYLDIKAYDRSDFN